MRESFHITPTPLRGSCVIARSRESDSRGYFERMFCEKELEDVLGARHLVQMNRTFTKKRGTVRGLHFQHPPHAEMKFVSCLQGEVFDVAVDVRQGSPTFLCWYAEILTAENQKTLVIPEGFAHGFQTLTDNVEMLYLHTAAYASIAEGGINPRDPYLNISWPQPISKISSRDAAHAMIIGDFKGVVV